MLIVIVICRFNKDGLQKLLTHTKHDLWHLSMIADELRRKVLRNLLENAERVCKLLLIFSILLCGSNFLQLQLLMGTHNFQTKALYWIYFSVQVATFCHFLSYGLAMELFILFGTYIVLIVKYKIFNSVIRGLQIHAQEKNYQLVQKSLNEMVEHHISLRRL